MLEKISYLWRDIDTKQEVAVGDDVTLKGETYPFYSDNRLVGDEIVGPCVVGKYEFVFKYEGVEKFTIPATITERNFKKITTSDEFDTTDLPTIYGSLYYYTIVGEVDGQLYVMQMPADASKTDANTTETEARLVTAGEDGGLTLGSQFDFVFTMFRYYQNSWVYYPSDSRDVENLLVDFGTGYYGSVYASDGVSLGGCVIYRKGWTSLSGGNIARHYTEPNSSTYGHLVKFASDGAVTIYAPRMGQTENNRLRLVKDGNKYVFTSEDATTDTRTSYPVYIYRHYFPITERYEFVGDKGACYKEYDGNPITFNLYKDFNIHNEEITDLGALVKNNMQGDNGTLYRFAYGEGKGENIVAATIQGENITGPNAVGDYVLFFQKQEKDGSWTTCGQELCYFSIMESST